MQCIAFALVVLNWLGSARRLQINGVDMEKMEAETGTSSHSLAELAQSSFAAVATAWNPSTIPRIGNHRIDKGISNGDRVPQTSMSSVEGRVRSPSASMNAEMKMPETALDSRMQVQKNAGPEEQKGKLKIVSVNQLSESSPLGSKETRPWYGNLGINALVLAVAAFCTRISVFLRSRGSPDAYKDLQPSISVGASPRAPAVSMSADGNVQEATKKKRVPIDFSLIVCVTLWYLGNYYYNITNKLALNAAGGVGGFPLTISTLQLAVGMVYGLFLWAAPDARKLPTITFKDWVATLPMSAASAAGHCLTVFAFSAGGVAFGQIIKAAKPACTAVMGLMFYNKNLSRGQWLSLIPVIGGVILASFGEMEFMWVAFATAMLSNIAGGIRANENKKLLEIPGVSERIGSVGNQYAISTINQLFIAMPFALLVEGHKLGYFFELCKTSSALWWNLIYSGLWYYLYNELATKVVDKTNAVTQTVLGTAKRVIIIFGVAVVLGESLPPIKLIGATIGIAGVFWYSMAK